MGLLILGGLLGLGGLVADIGTLIFSRTSSNDIFSFLELIVLYSIIGTTMELLSVYWLNKRSKLAVIGIFSSITTSGVYLSLPLIDFIGGTTGSGFFMIILFGLAWALLFAFPGIIISMLWKRKELS
ncbi:MAG: hypothetical protein M1587_06380 [Thaumarchaeota archaeon]|nr:hypothetical protein [Nitrososphaerota archaeon]